MSDSVIEKKAQCIALMSEGGSRWNASLRAALALHDLHLQILDSFPSERLHEALYGLYPLGLAGALIEGEGLQKRAMEELPRVEAEAREASMVDAVKVQFREAQGTFIFPDAARSLLENSGYRGGRILWVGRAVPGLRTLLRTASKVSVMQPNLPSAEAFLQQLPAPQRGQAVTAGAAAEALASEVDLVVYNGGVLPMSLLQPYHGLFAFVEPQQDAYLIVDQAISPDYFRRYYLSRLLYWVSGIDLPPEDFVE